MANSMTDFLLLGHAVRFFIDLAPYVLMSLMFMGLYVFMPNTHVKFKNAIVPGILSGIAMQLVQFFYIHSQMWVTGYNAIYGSFAALPLFMLWVQISWTICLFGVELTYTSQNLDYYDYESNTEDISHRYQMLMSAILMSRICKSFADGKSALTADDLREQTSIPIRVVNDLLYKLCEAHLVLEVSTDEKGEASTFVPAESLDNLNVGVMMDRLEAQGHWNLKLPINRLLTKKWGSVVSMRSDFFNRASSVRLEDIVL